MSEHVALSAGRWIEPTPQMPAAAGYRAADLGGLSGRPTYANTYGGMLSLPRAQSFQLLSQFRQNVPPLKRACEILSGFVGVPALVVKDNDRATAELAQWARSVEYGDGAGRGLQTWLDDAIGQALTYGFAVGEAQIAADRRSLERVWTYLSPGIEFRTDERGSLQTYQRGMLGREQTPLNPETTIRITHSPEGCDPYGESMFAALPLYCQSLLDIHHAYRATWRRNGIPIFHVNWEPPAEFQDPEGAIAARVSAALGASWNEAMRSQVMDGKAKDFYSTGKVTVQVIGSDGAVMDIEIGNRALLELIVSATGVPPFMFGFSWSSTERMSRQQADMLLATIDALRREVEPAIRFFADLHVRLSGRRDLLGYELRWPDVTMAEERETAFSNHFQGLALRSRQAVYRQLWADGVISQEQYAEEMIGDKKVAQAQDAPQPLPSAGQTGENGAGGGEDEDARSVERAEAQRLLGELLPEYRGLFQALDAGPSERTAPEYHGVFKHAGCTHGAKAGADDVAQLFPSEEPQYPGLTKEVRRVWRAVTAAYVELRADLFEAVGLDDPAEGTRSSGRSREKRDLTPAEQRALDEAIERFLQQMAGSLRTAAGFAGSDTEDGLIQQGLTLAWNAGAERAADVLRLANNPAFTASQRRRLLEESFARLSDGSKLRFEGRLTEIRDAMVTALNEGENPLTVARRLGKDLDGYWQGRLRTITRTEMGIAAEDAIRGTYAAHGVEQVEVIGDPNTDAACTAHIGKTYSLSDTDRLPIYHPNCYCSTVAVVEDEE